MNAEARRLPLRTDSVNFPCQLVNLSTRQLPQSLHVIEQTTQQLAEKCQNLLDCFFSQFHRIKDFLNSKSAFHIKARALLDPLFRFNLTVTVEVGTEVTMAADVGVMITV